MSVDLSSLSDFYDEFTGCLHRGGCFRGKLEPTHPRGDATADPKPIPADETRPVASPNIRLVRTPQQPWQSYRSILVGNVSQLGCLPVKTVVYC
jgi:hypothetical protein